MCISGKELFPTSDCLRASQREPMIHEEITRQDADLLCLQVKSLYPRIFSYRHDSFQEVDRLEKLLPMLEAANYCCQYAAGPRKRHGCLIAYKKDLYALVSHKVVFYDAEGVPHADESLHTGGSFKTRNIASLVALRRINFPSQGLVVATTHLFWHPCYTYERIRYALPQFGFYFTHGYLGN